MKSHYWQKLKIFPAHLKITTSPNAVSKCFMVQDLLSKITFCFVKFNMISTEHKERRWSVEQRRVRGS